MKPVELEIKLPTHKEYTVVHFQDNAKYPDIKATVRQLLRTCGWQWVRIGIGQNWSKKIYY